MECNSDFLSRVWCSDESLACAASEGHHAVLQAASACPDIVLHLTETAFLKTPIGLQSKGPAFATRALALLLSSSHPSFAASVDSIFAACESFLEKLLESVAAAVSVDTTKALLPAIKAAADPHAKGPKNPYSLEGMVANNFGNLTERSLGVLRILARLTRVLAPLDTIGLLDCLASLAAAPKIADKLWDVKVTTPSGTVSAVSLAIRLVREYETAPKASDVHAKRVADSMLEHRVRLRSTYPVAVVNKASHAGTYSASSLNILVYGANDLQRQRIASPSAPSLP